MRLPLFFLRMMILFRFATSSITSLTIDLGSLPSPPSCPAAPVSCLRSPVSSSYTASGIRSLIGSNADPKTVRGAVVAAPRLPDESKRSRFALPPLRLGTHIWAEDADGQGIDMTYAQQITPRRGSNIHAFSVAFCLVLR